MPKAKLSGEVEIVDVRDGEFWDPENIPEERVVELRPLKRVDGLIEINVKVFDKGPWDVCVTFWDDECEAHYMKLQDPLTGDVIPDLGFVRIKDILAVGMKATDHAINRLLENKLSEDGWLKIRTQGDELLIEFWAGDEDPQLAYYKSDVTVAKAELKTIYK